MLIKLIPKDAVIKIRRIFHHVGGIGFTGHQRVLINIALAGEPFPHNPVEVGNHQVASVVFRRPH